MNTVLESMAKIRQERAGAKYIMPTGENQALYRDNCTDMMEELTDLVNICNLLRQRLGKLSHEENLRLLIMVDRIIINVSQTADLVEALREQLPEYMCRDIIQVEIGRAHV